MKANLTCLSTFCLLLTACGGGGGGGGSTNPPPPAPPPPAPPPPVEGPTAPAIALARPISPSLLCGNGLEKRASALSSDQFMAAAGAVGINHWHTVDDADWTRESSSLESVMRTGAALVTKLNDDCWPDLAFTTGATASGQIVIYENLAGSGFGQELLSIAAAANPIAGLGAADLDGDYRPDLAAGNLLAGDTQLYRATGSGGFEPHQQISMTRSTFGFAFGDYSGDEWIDIFAAHWDIEPPATDSPVLLRNVGTSSSLPDGSLEQSDLAAGTTSASVPQDSNLAAGFTDLNADQSLDLLISADFGASQVLENTGSASFEALTGTAMLSDENAAGQAIRDLDNDGFWDWFVASVHDPGDARPWPWGLEGNKLYWGQGPSPYVTAANNAAGIANAEWPWGVCAEDFNNDGLTDLFVENGFGFAPATVLAAESTHPFVQQINDSLFDKQQSRARLFINQGNRTFADESLAWGIVGLTNGRGVACLDYDRDGDVDIAVAQNSGPALVYENQHSASDGNNFVSVSLVSAAPNTFAIGAVVEVEAGGVTQMRQLSMNSTFLGQDSYELHFGLAMETSVSQISVRWPDGRVTTYTDIPTNRFISLLDPLILPYDDAGRLDRIDSALTAATAYVSDPSRLTDDVLLGLTWMQRMHSISVPYSPANELGIREVNYDAAGNANLAQQLRTWRRLHDSGYVIAQADYDSLVGFDAVSFAGVYCHQIPLTDLYTQDLVDLNSQGAYATTHALLALLWALDNDCVMPGTYSDQILADVILNVYEIADGNGATEISDLRVEAMAFLAGAGRHDLIQAAWIDQLLDAQLGSGAWLGDSDDTDPNAHTTGLAFWLLLLLAEDVKALPGFVAQTWDSF